MSNFAVEIVVHRKQNETILKLSDHYTFWVNPSIVAAMGYKRGKKDCEAREG